MALDRNGKPYLMEVEVPSPSIEMPELNDINTVNKSEIVNKQLAYKATLSFAKYGLTALKEQEQKINEQYNALPEERSNEFSQGNRLK